MVKEWLADKEAQIELEYLPAYTPELNPDEYLNNDVKANVDRRAMPRNQQERQTSVQHDLRRMAAIPARVQAYFKSRHTQYAA